MSLNRVVEDILNSCPVCGFHTESGAQLLCPNPDHATLRHALVIECEDQIEMAQEHEAALKRADTLENTIESIQSYAETANSDMAKILDACDAI